MPWPLRPPLPTALPSWRLASAPPPRRALGRGLVRLPSPPRAAAAAPPGRFPSRRPRAAAGVPVGDREARARAPVGLAAGLGFGCSPSARQTIALPAPSGLRVGALALAGLRRPPRRESRSRLLSGRRAALFFRVGVAAGLREHLASHRRERDALPGEAAPIADADPSGRGTVLLLSRPLRAARAGASAAVLMPATAGGAWARDCWSPLLSSSLRWRAASSKARAAATSSAKLVQRVGV